MSHSRDAPLSPAQAELAASQLEDFCNLVLKREVGESVVFSIGCVPICRITVCRKDSQSIKLACEAAPHVAIDRESVFVDRLNENEALTQKQKDTIVTWLTNNRAR